MLSSMRCLTAVIGLITLPAIAAVAQPRDQRTYFTFSQAVELPNKTLPAGTYLFRLLDSPSNRHVVQVMNEDGSALQTTLMAIAAQRLTPSDEPEIRFMETEASAPSAIKTWWYPGSTTGHEFVWPREKAVRMARASKGSVLTVPEGTVWGSGAPPDDADLTRVGPDGEDAAVTASAKPAEVTGRAQTGRAASSTQTASARAQQPAPTPMSPDRTSRQPRTSLPATAGLLPLIGLIGVGSFVAAGVLRSRRRRQ